MTAPESPRVAVFDADSPQSLAFVRSLGRRGVAVDVYSEKRGAICKTSRWAAQGLLSPAVDSAVFIPWLSEHLSTGTIGLVAPTSEGVVRALAECSALLDNTFRNSMSPPAAVLDVLLKPRLLRAAAAAGARTPPTWYPDTLQAAGAIATDLPYPVALKPKWRLSPDMQAGPLIGSAEQFLSGFHEYRQTRGNEAFLARYPELRWPMVQRYLPSSRDETFSVSGFVGAHGRILAHSAAVSTDQWPPSLGTATNAQSVDDPKLIAEGLRLATALVPRGFFRIEFVRDPDSDELLMVDLQLHGHEQIALDIARGNDLPWIWYQSATGRNPQPLPPATRALSWRNFLAYHVPQWLGVLRGPQRYKKWQRYSRRRMFGHIDACLSLRDPIPGLIAQLKMLSVATHMVRPLLTRRNAPRVPAPPSPYRPTRMAAQGTMPARTPAEPVPLPRVGPILGLQLVQYGCDALVAHMLEHRPPADGPALVVTPNIDHIAQLRNSGDFFEAYHFASAVTCDGFPVQLYARLCGHRIPRVTGCDLVSGLMRAPRALMAAQRWFFLLDADSTAVAVAAWARHHGISERVVTEVPPFGFSEDAEYCGALARRMRDYDPTVTLLAVGAPRSEIFTWRYRALLPASWTLCIGQAVKTELELIQRAPKVVQNLRLEWLWRIAQEPRRLAGRYVRALWGFGGAIFEDRWIHKRQPTG